MDNSARAEKIVNKTMPDHLWVKTWNAYVDVTDWKKSLIEVFTSQLDEACNEQWREDMKHCEADRKERIDQAVKEAIETFIIEATENDPRLAAAKAKFIAQGYAAAREQDLKVVDSYLGDEDDTADKIGKRIRRARR